MDGFKKGQRVNTPDGVGSVAAFESTLSAPCRVGVIHDAYPTDKTPGLYSDNILYYRSSEIEAA